MDACQRYDRDGFERIGNWSIFQVRRGQPPLDRD
jgi:hypothetical protein